MKVFSVFFIFLIEISSAFGQTILPIDQCRRDADIMARNGLDFETALSVRDFRKACDLGQWLTVHWEGCNTYFSTAKKNALVNTFDHQFYSGVKNICRCARTNAC